MRSFCLDCSNYIADGVAHNCQVLMANGFVDMKHKAGKHGAVGMLKKFKNVILNICAECNEPIGQLSKEGQKATKEELNKKQFRPYRAGHGKGWG